MRQLVLRTFQSPGDVLMLTAAVRDLHAAHPKRFVTDVRTSAPALWEQNPYISRLPDSGADIQTVEMHYPLVHQSNQRPYHFLHGYVQFLEEQLKLQIPLTRFQGDIHLSPEERAARCPGAGHGVPERFWIVIAGGKYDFTAKWWNPDSYQKVVDHFRNKITFVQCGEAGHWHPPLERVVNLVGKTNQREFVRLMYHADGVLCPVTFAMHLAAAVPTKPDRPRQRACVVVAGGREPAHWEAYSHHQFLSTLGMFSCCEEGGCWKSRCQVVGDGDDKDRRNLCERPVQVRPDLRIPQCMEVITPADVIRKIEMYYSGGLLNYSNNGQGATSGNGQTESLRVLDAAAPVALAASNIAADRDEARLPMAEPNRDGAPVPPEQIPIGVMSRSLGKHTGRQILLEFPHGLGDTVQLTIVLQHLQHYHPDWSVDVVTYPGRGTAIRGLVRNVFSFNDRHLGNADYDQVYKLTWDACETANSQWPSSKPIRCLLEVFQLSPQLDFCRYKLDISDEARSAAREYLGRLCPKGPLQSGRFPTVLIHFEGATSGNLKNIPLEVVGELCDLILEARHVPVILDWNKRCPLADHIDIHNPGRHHPLWGGAETGHAETLAALIEASSLMIGIDSGPLHIAGATTTPAIGVWTELHPIHFFDIAPNVIHLVPEKHETLAAGPLGLEFFRRQYRHLVYRKLHIDLPALAESMLSGESFEHLATKRFLKRLTATGYGEQYYVEHREAGLDYLNYGEWQQQYGGWFVESLELQDKKILDVGCACGAVLRGLAEAGAEVRGVELNEHMVALAREKWPDIGKLMNICDAVNLHIFSDKQWDVIHTAQVAEHWKPELVPFILRELARVTVPGGLLFCALDTTELFARQGRNLKHEDPTHLCIRPMTWWHERLRESGWELFTSEVEAKLRDHPQSYLKRYDWDWFLARRVAARVSPPNELEGS